MKLVSALTVTALCGLAACAKDAVSPSIQAPLSAIVAGNPPPPPVLGFMSGTFSPLAGVASGPQAGLSFRATARYNRNLTTGAELVEFEPGPGKILTNPSGVQRAFGIIVLTNPSNGATLTFDLSQLVGFQGPLFVPCLAGSAVNCFLISPAVLGTIQLRNGRMYPAAGQLRYRWETGAP
ncbi:MAG: hypothetical protein ABIZ91_10945 [Gemmatimonadaceae bacterium]